MKSRVTCGNARDAASDVPSASRWVGATLAVAGVRSKGGISVSMLRSLVVEIDGDSSVAAPAVGASAKTQSAAIAWLIDIGR
ncbi:hypothetical protein [Xanthomonas euvesicatoria]|uniref:hypothetical protein n=1 Tax=Xanthomonas euvesicatoria TaxID=456327 RepID=UPI0024060B9D|nr:hypothetical protein [Xanthomonas euvesicatoria]